MYTLYLAVGFTSVTFSVFSVHLSQQNDASKVRQVTSEALNILSAFEAGASSPAKDDNRNQSDSSASEVEVELDLTFEQYDLLYSAGLITHEQIRKGSVKRRDYDAIERFLADEQRIEEEIARKVAAQQGHALDTSDVIVTPEFPAVLDCGLKRVDSKRYGKDFIVNRGTPQAKRRQWRVKTSSVEGTEVIKATPAGERELVHSEDTREVSINAVFLSGVRFTSNFNTKHSDLKVNTEYCT